MAKRQSTMKALPKVADVTIAVHQEVLGALSDTEGLSFLGSDAGIQRLVGRSLPDTTLPVAQFQRAYWMAECLSKFPYEVQGIDRAAVARESFFSAEQRCSSANFSTGFYPNQFCDTSRVVRKARKKLRWLLSGISRDEVMQRARWGPGASTSLSRRQSSPQLKWDLATHVTLRCLPWVTSFHGWSGRESSLQVVSGNRITTVPKNAKTDRTIGIEPDWNCFFQLGLGASIRRRLQRVGLLHKDAQERNKKLARTGSLTGAFATIDLKAASDTLSLGLCDLLLPGDLLSLIFELRSDYGLYDDTVVHYEKVSSMGNGFTFELETAMFWALASSCDPSDDAAVYGDDIIVTTEAVPLLLAVLQDLGLEVNGKKTHHTGPFRESCGGHFYHGIDVTPPYFKERVECIPSYIRAYNKLTAAFGRSDVSEMLRQAVPKFLWGPRWRGDTVLASEWDETVPTWKAGTQSYKLREVVETRRMAESPSTGALLHALWGASFVHEYPTRDRVVRVRKYTSCRF